MKAIILVDQKGFNLQETAALQIDLGYGNEDLLGRIPCQLILQQGNQMAVPTLIFLDEAQEKQFFYLVRKKKEIIAFTTMPYDKLVKFYNKRFYDNLRSISIEITALENNLEYSMYADRMIKFRFLQEIPVEFNIETAVIYQQKELSYQLYINPLILEIPNDKMFTCYRKFYENKENFPIALPPFIPDLNNSYFSTINLPTHNKISLIELRNRVRKYFKDNNTLFYALWQIPDKPIFKEYLKDGAYFRLDSKNYTMPFSADNILPFEEDGPTLLSFNYYYNESDSSYISRWRGSILHIDEKESTQLCALKNALIRDIIDAFPGLEIRIERYCGEKEQDIFDWNDIQLKSFDNQYARDKDGYWEEIRDFILKVNDYDLTLFVKSKILDPGQAQGNVNADHNLTREGFVDYLCAFLFNDKREFKYAWLDSLIDFIRNDGVLNPISIYRDEKGVYLYDKRLSSQEMLKLRLSLPVNAIIQCRATNILDHSNAFLDEKFILE